MKMIIILIAACLVGTNAHKNTSLISTSSKPKPSAPQYADSEYRATSKYIDLRLERIERILGITTALPKTEDVEAAYSNIVDVAKKYEVGFARKKIGDRPMTHEYDREIGAVSDSVCVLKSAGISIDITKNIGLDGGIVYKDPKDMLEYIDAVRGSVKPITAPLVDLRMDHERLGVYIWRR